VKAVLLKPGSGASVEEVQEPVSQKGEVVVELIACGLCGTDVERIRGCYSAGKAVLGHEAVGKVIEIGRAVGESQGGEVDIVEAVRSNSLVHIDMSGAQSWDEIVNAAREAVEECYREARTDQSFGVAVFIDEVHNFVPQSPSEGAASRQAYEEMIPVMKLVATTGPRNGVPLFIATQRLSESDKFITTQMGQNIFAFRVEDVDLLRLREIVGSDIAYAARTLPRGYCIYKGHALRVQRPVIAVVEKAGDVASVGKDLLTRWTQG